MSHNHPTEDEKFSYGTYRPSALTRILINLTRSLPTGWLGRRLMFALRRIAAMGVDEKIDTVLFGFPMRLHSSGNVSEKRALFAPQFFDLEERLLLNSLAEDKAVFIDIGANIGLYSFSVAAAFKNFKNTRILAVEPHPIMSNRLVYNLSLNPGLPIELIEAALSDREGEMTMVTPDTNLGESRLLKTGETASGRTTKVPVKTLLKLLADQNVNRLDGMKIDIEGYEEAVLIPFFEQAPEHLLPKLIIMENNYEKWETDLTSIAGIRGYGIKKTTRMNVILEKIHFEKE